jgi:hypothetical protein
MKKIVFFIILLLNLSCNNSKEKTDKIEFKKLEKFSNFYDLKNIKAVEITNINGTRYLNKSELDSFVIDLNTYYFNQKNARTKPGHVQGIIEFNDNNKIWFYSNSNSEIMLYYLSKNENLITFKTNAKVDFEKY